MSRWAASLCVAACALVSAIAASAGTSVGVAPFERQGPAGARVFDVAPRLAQRLGAAGLERVVGPAELGARRTSSPTAEELEAWGSSGEVASIVVGRVTRFGSSLSVDARLYDTLTALQIGAPIVAEVADPDDLGRALDGVARQVVVQLRSDSGAGAATPAPGKQSGNGRAAASAANPSAGAPDEPIEITSDGLTFEPSPGGGRKMDFEGNVRIRKGPLRVSSRVARALYAAGSSAPEEIVARGDVVILQEGRTARCQQADFDQVRNRMICTGAPAILEQGCDRVRGDKITFSLGTEELNVEGNVEVKRIPECTDPA